MDGAEQRDERSSLRWRKECDPITGQVDLHMHSAASDGTDPPRRLAERVSAAHIRIFALTDHDTVAGVEELMDGPLDGLIFIPGIEFSCRMASGKCHILGYGCDIRHPAFRKALEEGAALRRAKLEQRLAFLREREIQFPREELDRLREMSSAGKPHLANLMVRFGYARDRGEAIESTINLCQTGSSRIPAETALLAITASGGVPVWAHPLGGEGEKPVGPAQFDRMLDELMGYGLKGMECWYSKYSPADCEALAGIARGRGLLISGGSDYHGTNKAIAPGTLNADGQVVPPEQLTLLDVLLGEYTSQPPGG